MPYEEKKLIKEARCIKVYNLINIRAENRILKISPLVLVRPLKCSLVIFGAQRIFPTQTPSIPHLCPQVLNVSHYFNFFNPEFIVLDC